MCGEKFLKCEAAAIAKGSPPRVRGKALSTTAAASRPRITPACAGKSNPHGLAHHFSGDHPRVCGEKSSRKTSCSARRGSPPRVRGKVFSLMVVMPRDWITPACAGKRAFQTVQKIGREDHPRVCGEKLMTSQGVFPCGGSPPRVRGKVHKPRRASCSQRITPACAGKSPCASGFANNPEDHPRVCGEKSICTAFPYRNPGSPPRVRGKGERGEKP